MLNQFHATMEFKDPSEQTGSELAIEAVLKAKAIVVICGI
jgi:hypothetical protein